MKALETAVVNRITADPNLPSNIAVLLWPDKPLKVSVPSGSTAAIIVRFIGVELQPMVSPNRSRLVQNGKIELEIRFFVKTLREGNGAYDLMHFAQRSLSHWLPSSSELEQYYLADNPGLQMVSEQLVANDKTIWDWGQIYNLPVTYTQRSS